MTNHLGGSVLFQSGMVELSRLFGLKSFNLYSSLMAHLNVKPDLSLVFLMASSINDNGWDKVGLNNHKTGAM